MDYHEIQRSRRLLEMKGIRYRKSPVAVSPRNIRTILAIVVDNNAMRHGY